MEGKKKHIVRDDGTKSLYDLKEMIYLAQRKGQSVVLVMGPGARGSYDLKELESAGAEIMIARSAKQADEIFQRLILEHHGKW